MTLVFSILITTISVVFSIDVFATVSEEIFMNVKYSKPAICCDVGQIIDLSKCGVQFSETSSAIKSDIIWTYEGEEITQFAPSAKGVYALTATFGDTSKTVYVVAKNSTENEYVLYRNDFNKAPTDFRVIEQTSGTSITTENGAYILNANYTADSYIRVLLPEYLDDFGDVNIKANVKNEAAIDDAKWGALMYRVQNVNYPYMQCAFRYNAAASSGTEIAHRNSSNAWQIFSNGSFGYMSRSSYNLFNIRLNGTKVELNVNGYDLLSYSSAPYVTGAMGFQTRGTKLCIDYIEITIEDTPMVSSDASFAKPALCADLGDVVDLTSCNVQFTNGGALVSGSEIVWKNGEDVITSFEPTEKGVVKLSATWNGTTKDIFVVTRNLNETEYVLYYNDFVEAPDDIRIVTGTSSTAYHNAARGTFELDASATQFGRVYVLLPAYLDNFGDVKFEARYTESKYYDTARWTSLTFRIQSNRQKYMQFDTRYNATSYNGVEISDAGTVYEYRATDLKTSSGWNTYVTDMAGTKIVGYINGTQMLYYNALANATGALGFQACGLKTSIDYVKVTIKKSTVVNSGSCGSGVSYTQYTDGEVSISGSGAMDANAFSGNNAIDKISIVQGVTSIGTNSFAMCENLTSVTIPDSVTSIDASAFRGCENLSNLYVGSNNSSFTYENGVLYDKNKTKVVLYLSTNLSTDYAIPYGIVSIGAFAFGNSSGFESITIPDSVVIIEDFAFYNNKSLKSVTIGAGVKIIGDDAFYNCENLSVVTMGNNVETIGDEAFYNCNRLSSIFIPAGVKTIGDEAFYSCDDLSSISFGYMCGATIGDYAFACCPSLTSVTVPNTVPCLGKGAFYLCINLKKAEISGAVTVIDDYTFAWCENLVIATIPQGVTKIGEYAFYGCSKLSTAAIPSSVTSIGACAFSNCEGIDFVTIYDSVIHIGEEAFGYFDGERVENFVIYGEAATEGEAYALNNGFEFIEVDFNTVVFTSDDIEVSGDLAKGFFAEETVSDLVGVVGNYQYIVESKDGELLSDDDVVGTGSVISVINDGFVTDSVTVVVNGDTNGDGKVNSTDALQIKRTLLKSYVLEGAYYSASDTNDDGLLNSTDYLRIKAHFLGRYNLYK